jgi:divalent metal cation (Fe/Co/Zn/Cd) transporter
MEENKERTVHPPREERRPPGQPDRDAVIVRTSVIGIAVNLALGAGKAAVGLAVRSIAVVLDAVNNLSDALSAVITILGAKLSGKMPDKKHPLGYGRVEYLSATVVAASRPWRSR